MERERKTGAWTAAAAVLVLLLPVVYVLSIGPAVWAYRQGLVSEGPVQVVYRPLEWAVEAAPRLTSPLLWYVDLWDGPDVGFDHTNAPLPEPPVPDFDVEFP